jgi:hypothetical protein
MNPLFNICTCVETAPVLTTVCILPSCTLVHFNPPWNPSHCRKESEGRKILLQQPIVHCLEVIHWVRVQNSIGRIWSELGDDEDADAPCICHLWLASRFFMTEMWSNVTERYKPKPSSPGKKSWRKGASFPSRKKAYSFVFRCLHIHKILGTLIALMNSTYTFLKCWHISLTGIRRKDSL